MAKLSLMLACNPYDRVQPLIDGSVQPDGVELSCITRLSPGEIFWRMLRHEEFDVSELSLSAYILGLARVAVHDVASHHVHCAKATDVELTMVDGRIVMENRWMAHLDEPRLLREAQAAGRSLVQRLGQQGRRLRQ